MPKEKYDWPKIKQEFFESNNLEVKQFFEEKFKIYNATIAGKTKGWNKEKKTWQEKIVERIISERADKEVKEKKKWLNNILIGIAKHVRNAESLDSLTVKEKQIIWKIFRTENKLPVVISRLEQEEKMVDEFSSDHAEEIAQALTDAENEDDATPSEDPSE